MNHLNRISGAKILPTIKKAKGYGNNVINFKGEASLRVTYGKKSVLHNFLVVNDSHVSLLGRDLCLKLGIKMLFPNVNALSISNVDIFTKFKDYLFNNFQSSVKETV